MKLDFLRKKYPQFIYEKYSWRISEKNLEILFDFRIGSDIKFRPKIIVENVAPKEIKRIGENVLNNLVFNLGLMEIPSYWKATCSPEILVKAGCLNQEQINWWKNLFIKGLGQFYYENKIDWRGKDFLKIVPACPNDKKNAPNVFLPKMKNRYLVPFAGGRDSIVTLEGLKKAKRQIALFTVNTINRIQKTVKVSGIKKQVVVKRIIDEKLLKLNEKGYLNGHTPFTALLSFLSVLCAVIFDYKNIAFSNEKSADEGNVKYLGKVINHQWAKSSEFEKMFSVYAKKYLLAGRHGINYFSYLRKYTELEISKMLTKYPKYFSVFSSCNAGMRTNTVKKEKWCGNCPKCLFVYLTLYPFLKEKELFKIFGQDIFENRGLMPIMKALIGNKTPKPFECVGTKEESRLAFHLCLKKAQKSGKIPYLLAAFFI